jgi:hypothetical protein
VRRKYSIRGHGPRSHPIPIGIPSSFSEKISNVFKGRRAARGWVPARDEEDEWDTRDEPLRERERGQLHHDGEYEPRRQQQQQQHDELPRVGSASASYHATLTEPSEVGQLSRSASHVDPDEISLSCLGRDAQLPSVPTAEPEEGWLNADFDTTRPTITVGGSGNPDPVGNFAPHPRRADSGEDIPLFAGSTPFR